MNLLQKINNVFSAGSFRWRRLVVWTGIFCFLFSAAGIGCLNGFASTRIPQTIESNALLPMQGQWHAVALWENSSPQLAQTVLRRARSSQQHSSPWRLRVILHSVTATFEIQPQQPFYQRQAVSCSTIHRYLKNSLPVRAGPSFCC